MQIGIFAKTFPEIGAGPVLAAVRNAGYAATQFNMSCLCLPSMPDTIDGAMAASVAQASWSTGVSVAAVSGTYNMIHPDPAARQDGLARLKVLIAAARTMGTRLVTLCTGTRHPLDQWTGHPENESPDAWRDLVVEMSNAAAAAEAHGVDLGIEPELANVVSSAAKARRLIDEIGSPRLKIVLDPANLFERAGEAERRRLVEEAVAILGDRLAMAHAKDRAADGSFVAAGRGVIDFHHFVRALRGAGFDGPLVTHGLSAQEAPHVSKFLVAAVDEVS
jgi:sugar phosphate isomerase/epimerase